MRRRTLLWLAAFLWSAAAVSVGVSWLLVQGAIPTGTGRQALADAAPVLAIAAAATTVLWLGFRAMALALRRRSHSALRSLGHLQVVAAFLVVIAATLAIVGDLSSTLISLGLVGFGLTIALQRPILAVAGWATIFFGGMFREGDRIQVGDLEGDVLDITLFTTKLWEIGSPRTPTRPTGRIRTVSNALFLEEPVANATSDTAIVFDEFVVNVAFEADLAAAQDILHRIADGVLEPARHEEMARTYRKLTRGMPMEAVFPDRPSILMEAQDSWMDLRLRYLVEARRAGAIKTALTEAWAAASSQEDLPAIYRRQQTMRIDAEGRVIE